MAEAKIRIVEDEAITTGDIQDRLKGDMDGIEAAEQIRDRFDVPVVYLTAYYR